MRKTVPPEERPPRPAAPGTGRVDLNELVIFTRVVQSGSFTAAARLLDLPKSTVSRKIAELEERVGARLLQRTTRKLGLTDAGRTYFGYTERIVADAEAADRALGSLEAAPRGLLRVTAPLSFTVLGPIVAEYLERNPEVQLELVCTDRRVGLIEEGFDLAVRVGQLNDSSLVVRPLGMVRRVLVASPSYERQAGAPRRPEDLPRHKTLAFGGGPTPSVWALRAGDRALEVLIAPRMTVNELDLLGEVVRAGLGVALMPEFAIERDLREGTLLRLMPEWHSEDVPLQAVYPTARHLSPKVTAFVELLLARLHSGKPKGAPRKKS